MRQHTFRIPFYRSDVNVMNKMNAEKHCQSLNKELPDSTLDQTPLSGTVGAEVEFK